MDSKMIYERLKALGSGGEQELYRDISQAFEEVIHYNRTALEALQEQLKKELRDVSERYYLYGTLIRDEDIPIVNDFLFPMCEEPAQDDIRTVFCEGTLSAVAELFDTVQRIIIRTDRGELEADACFRPCARYRKEVEKLKHIYYDNGLYFRTPYLPYISRFADLECNIFKDIGRINAISLPYRQNPILIRMDYLPVWNVEKIKSKCTVFPIPAVDEQHYRHSLKLPSARDGYAVLMEPSIRSVFYEEDELVLITEDVKQKEFDLYRIAAKREVSVPHYPLTTNARMMRFIDRQAENAVKRLRTVAEIGRMAGSYEAGKDFELTGIDLEEGRLLLKFRVPEETFLTEDQTAFLVKEVQEYFPQFEVVGEVQV